VFTEKKRAEKLRYMDRNRVAVWYFERNDGPGTAIATAPEARGPMFVNEAQKAEMRARNRVILKPRAKPSGLWYPTRRKPRRVGQSLQE
jgi:hypothetical protein